MTCRAVSLDQQTDNELQWPFRDSLAARVVCPTVFKVIANGTRNFLVVPSETRRLQSFWKPCKPFDANQCLSACLGRYSNQKPFSCKWHHSKLPRHVFSAKSLPVRAAMLTTLCCSIPLRLKKPERFLNECQYRNTQTVVFMQQTQQREKYS